MALVVIGVKFVFNVGQRETLARKSIDDVRVAVRAPFFESTGSKMKNDM